MLARQALDCVLHPSAPFEWLIFLFQSVYYASAIVLVVKGRRKFVVAEIFRRCISYFIHCYDQILDSKQLRKEKVYLAYSVKGMNSTRSREGMVQGPEAAGHAVPDSKREEL